MAWPTSPAEIPDTMPLARIAEIEAACRDTYLDHCQGRAVDADELLAAELGVLAVHAALEQRAQQYRWADVLAALRAGATVGQVARATGLDETHLRECLAGWVERQHGAGYLSDADTALVQQLITAGDDPRRIRIGEPAGRVSSVEFAHLQACNEDRLRGRYAPAGRVHSIADARLMADIEDGLRKKVRRLQKQGILRTASGGERRA